MTSAKAKFAGFCHQHLATLTKRTIRNMKCRFTEIFDCYFRISLSIVTKHKLGLPFIPLNLYIKFGTNPSTIFLVIVVIGSNSHRQTHKPTPVNNTLILFA